MALFSTAAQDLQFYKEDLHFELREGVFSVDGWYYFSNPSDQPIKTVLVYPFPVNDSLYSDATDIRILKIGNDSASLLIDYTKTAATFLVEIPPYESVKYRIHYLQGVKQGQAQYILTTTLAWGRPLETANYTLTVPGDVQIKWFSIPPDQQEKINSTNVYYWERKDFIPATDMIFRF